MRRREASRPCQRCETHFPAQISFDEGYGCSDSGAIVGGATETELEGVTSYAANLGLLFQITDDLLDVTATTVDLGKTPGKDARSRKATYPALVAGAYRAPIPTRY